MKNLKEYLLTAICSLLILLWAYAASSKLMDFGIFVSEMQRQILFPFLKASLPYLLPPAEILIVIFLLLKPLQIIGLYLSFLMLFVFTVYIGLAISDALGEIPCSCGGILNRMGWLPHFVFNTFFLLLNAAGIYLYNRERRQINRKTI